MSRKKEYFQKWKTNYDFKTFTNATVSTVITFVFALYNGFLGLRYASLWYGSFHGYVDLVDQRRDHVRDHGDLFVRADQKHTEL